MIDALVKLTDSLFKAGSSFIALIGGVLLFEIAAIASGALVGFSQPIKPAASQPSINLRHAPATPPTNASDSSLSAGRSQ